MRRGDIRGEIPLRTRADLMFSRQLKDSFLLPKKIRAKVNFSFTRVLVKISILVCFTGRLCFKNSSIRTAPVSDRNYDALSNLVESCAPFVHAVESNSDDSGTLPEVLVEMVSLADHVFVMSLEGCATKLPSALTTRSSCIHGKALDKCIPQEFVTGGHLHAMKVTFMHAAIIQLSINAGHQSIAFIEDDIRFLARRLSATAVTNFKRLYWSDRWNFIRLGFRPYFLQDNGGATPCPRRCRCFLTDSFGEHLCELRAAGCDIRSSDFYFLHSRVFSSFRSRLLDLRQANSKRIVDVHPMRSYGRQWLLIPQVSYQNTSDIPVDYQVGTGALYIKKCAGPRPLPESVSVQLTASG